LLKPEVASVLHPLKLIEIALIKLKSKKISVEPEKGLFLGSNRPYSYES